MLCDHCVRGIFHWLFGCYTNTKTSVFTEQDDGCGNSLTQSQASEDGNINVRNMLCA